MKSNYFIIPLVVLSIGSLLLSDNLEFAYALSLTTYENGTTEVRAIVTKYGNPIGDITAIGDITTDSVYLRNANTQALLATITGVTDPAYAFVSNTDNGEDFVYFVGGATGNTIYEINIVLEVLIRSVVTSCSATSDGFYVDSNAGFFYCADTSELVYKYSIGSLVASYVSTTLNAGATPCDGIEGLSYDSGGDNMFALCATTDNIVGVVDYLVSGTPDFSIAYGLITGGQIAYNMREDNIVACSNALAPRLYTWSDSTGFTFVEDLETSAINCQTNKYAGRLTYDFTTDRYFLLASDQILRIYDGTNGNGILAIDTGGFGNGGMIQVTGTDLLAIPQVWGTFETAGASVDYYNVDLAGVALGSNGEPFSGGGGTGGIDCTLPENAQILICRLGGQDCEGNVLTCVGDTVRGNATSGTGLIGVICGVGFVDCAANPDIKTNGIGYLLLAVALGIEIGILWVASRGDLRQIPTFIWFIATIAIIAALTLLNWIDATMLVLGVIVAVALAAAKARGFFGGDSF